MTQLLYEGQPSIWNYIGRFLHFITTTRYTRLLEDRVETLELENQVLRNAMNERAGIPGIDYQQGRVKEPRKLEMPKPKRWQDIKARLEAASRERLAEKIKNAPKENNNAVV